MGDIRRQLVKVIKSSYTVCVMCWLYYETSSFFFFFLEVLFYSSFKHPLKGSGYNSAKRQKFKQGMRK